MVRYGAGKNPVLRLALHTLWGQKCYWCNAPKDYNDTQIDHIIPRSQCATDRAALLHACRLPADFDVDDPRNLAPICAPCNGSAGKGAADLSDTPMLLRKLRQADALRPKVIQMVTEFGNSRRTAESLLRAIETDLNDPRARAAFTAHAPGVVQKLAMLDESLADYHTSRIVEFALGLSEPLEVELLLNARGRTTLTIVEDVYGRPVIEVLGEGLPTLIELAQARAQAEFNDESAEGGPMYAGPPTTHFVEIQIDAVDFDRQGPILDVSFAGTFTGSYSLSVVQDSMDGIGLDELQGDVELTGRFTLRATWDGPTNDGAPDIVDCDEATWDVEGYLTR